jgi:single-strand DNA-binding protein
MNQVILIGRLTADPELRQTQTGTAVTGFSIAINRGRDRDGNDLGADFPRVTVWGRQAETCVQYLHKGDQCAVSGRLQTGKYQDKDGRTVYKTDVIAHRVEFLQTKRTAEDRERDDRRAVQETLSRYREYPGDLQTNFKEIDDDVPF